MGNMQHGNCLIWEICNMGEMQWGKMQYWNYEIWGKCNVGKLQYGKNTIWKNTVGKIYIQQGEQGGARREKEF